MLNLCLSRFPDSSSPLFWQSAPSLKYPLFSLSLHAFRTSGSHATQHSFLNWKGTTLSFSSNPLKLLALCGIIKRRWTCGLNCSKSVWCRHGLSDAVLSSSSQCLRTALSKTFAHSSTRVTFMLLPSRDCAYRNDLHFVLVFITQRI